MSKSPLTIVQITDTHLFADAEQALRGFQTARSLQAVLEAVQALQPVPDLLLLTGDLSQDETAGSYQRLQDMVVPLGIPAYWIPGNHDIPELMQQVLTTLRAEKCVQQGGWNLVLLNSAVSGRVDGELSSASLDWLDQQLQSYADLQTLIALHHPAATIGSEWMDEISLLNRQDLYRIIDRHPQVKLVIFGHIHQEFMGERQGVLYLGTPSTCVQFKPRREEIAIDELTPGFRVLTLEANGQYTTTVQRVAYQPLEAAIADF